MAATESSTRAMAALDDLYRRHVGDVYRYTYAVLGNHADAEDVTQTTFVNALRALERGETPREASHWLLAIAHNLVRQRWRQAAARPTLVELVNDVPDEVPEDDVALDELVRALQRIPPSQREALVMRELEGRSYKEISELLGLTTSALETLLFRARRSLAEELENLVTCQTAERSLSRQSDGRLSRKERKRLDAHVAECPSCARFARTQASQRKAFKGLALLPVPVGLALFRDAPVAAAATLPTIGGTATTGGAGTGGTVAGTSAAGGSVGVGGTLAGGSFLGAAAVKVAIAVVAATVVVGVGYQGVKAVRDGSAPDARVATEVSAAAPASEPAAPAAGPSDGLGSGTTEVTALAEPSETGGATSPTRKGALPLQTDDAAPEGVASTPGGETPHSIARDGDPAAEDGSAARGDLPAPPIAGGPSGDGAASAGDASGTPAAAAPEPVTQPTQPSAPATASPKPRSTPKSKAKPKQPKSKPPTAKGPKAGKPSDAPAGGGKAAEAPGRQKEPAAQPPTTAPPTETPAAASAPPPTSPTTPAAGDAPSDGNGKGWSPDNGNSAAAPGHSK